MLTIFVASIAIFSDKSFTASTTGNATVSILQQLSISETTGINFGSITVTSAAGNVVLSTAGSVTNCASGVYTCSGSPTAGSFNISGTASTAVTVSVDASTSLTGPGTSMTLTLSGNNTGSQTLNGSGNLTLNVGGTLAVNANQAAGTYSGTYTATVNY
jgi:hypothetical protein